MTRSLRTLQPSIHWVVFTLHRLRQPVPPPRKSLLLRLQEVEQQQHQNAVLSFVRNFSSSSTSLVVKYQPDSSLVDVTHAPIDFDRSSAVVYPNIIPNEISQSIIQELEKNILKRQRYSKGHWDSVIVKFKETELINNEIFSGSDSDNVQSLLRDVTNNVRNNILLKNHFCHQDTATSDIVDSASSTPPDAQSLLPVVTWLPCHVIDLHVDGMLNPHVDSIRFSGGIVAGLSLKTNSIMRLRPVRSTDHCLEKENQMHTTYNDQQQLNTDTAYVDMYLPMNSLYVLSGMSRYHYTHELLPPSSHLESGFRPGTILAQDNNNKTDSFRTRHTNRISIIFRDALE